MRRRQQRPVQGRQRRVPETRGRARELERVGRDVQLRRLDGQLERDGLPKPKRDRPRSPSAVRWRVASLAMIAFCDFPMP
jgi:hypothetical protein